jgi:hypothetical protein
MYGLPASKRVQNDIFQCESESDKKVAPESYYILKITLNTFDVERGTLNSYIKTLLKERAHTHCPLVGYVYKNTSYMVFSSRDEEHYMEGSHQGICSEYASMFAIHFGCNIDIRLVELDTRTRIITYFHSKIHDNTKQTMIECSNAQITKRDINNFTFGECLELLSKKNISWEGISTSDKYGTFYKYIVDGETEKYMTLSEIIDVRDMKRYMTYFFE